MYNTKLKLYGSLGPSSTVFIPEEKGYECTEKFFGKVYAWYQQDINFSLFNWPDHFSI